MVPFERGEHLPPSLVPHHDVLPVLRHSLSRERDAHVADDEVGQGVRVVEAGVAGRGDDVGEL